MRRVLVTGGAGYIGAVLVPKLAAKDNHVRVLDLFLYADENIYTPELKKSGQLEILKGDMREPALLDKAVAGVDTIINLGAVSNDPSSDLDPNLTRQVNIDATKLLIDKAKAAGVKRFISASSSSVYGIKDDPDVTEELSLEPLTVYSESKVVIEDYLKHNRGKMTAVSMRTATICGYSPRMRLDLTVNILTHHAVRKGKITVFGGAQKRPNLHIEDVTDMYTNMLDYPSEKIDGEAFNVCGANHTVMEIAEIVREVVDPSLPITVTDSDDPRSYHVSGAKIKRVLGYEPRRTVADASRDVATALREGKIPNPDAAKYYNVKTMKEVLKLS